MTSTRYFGTFLGFCLLSMAISTGRTPMPDLGSRLYECVDSILSFFQGVFFVLWVTAKDKQT